MTRILTVFLFLATAPAKSDDWPHWRGPSRDGIVKESSGYLEGETWLPKKADWLYEAGEGSSSPIVVDGRVYVLGWKDGKDTLHCLDLKNGKPVWRQDYENPKHGRHAAGDQRRYGGPTATPEFDPKTKLLFTLSSDGELRAWNVSGSSEPVWRKNLYDAYDVQQRPKIGGGLRDYGYTTSPLAIDGQLLVEVGSEKGTVIAFDPKNGDELWKSQYNKPAGHTGGLVPITVEGIPCVAVLALHDLVVIRLDSGKEGATLATHPWESDWANNILTPTAFGNEILISSYHTHRSIRKIKITSNRAQKVWESLFASHTGSPLIHDGKIYFAGRRLYCLDWETGKLDWEGGVFGDGASLVYTADHRLLAYGGDCSLILADSWKNSPESYNELAKIQGATAGGPGDAWPHVTLADGWVLCKNRQGQITARQTNHDS